MLFERIRASGVGLTIGSIGTSIVRNITFRDCYMHNTWKGIYMKFRGGDEAKGDVWFYELFLDSFILGGSVSNVLYENIYIEAPEQFAIWIGPAQQYLEPCSIFWPQFEWAGAKCNFEDRNFIFENITLRNITVVDPKYSYGQGIVLGNLETPMKVNVLKILDGVRNVWHMHGIVRTSFLMGWGP